MLNSAPRGRSKRWNTCFSTCLSSPAPWRRSGLIIIAGFKDDQPPALVQSIHSARHSCDCQRTSNARLFRKFPTFGAIIGLVQDWPSVFVSRSGSTISAGMLLGAPVPEFSFAAAVILTRGVAASRDADQRRIAKPSWPTPRRPQSRRFRRCHQLTESFSSPRCSFPG